MKIQARMSLQFSDGTDNDGNELRRQSNYNIHIDAENEQVITVGTALSTLTSSSLIDLHLIETSALV